MYDYYVTQGLNASIFNLPWLLSVHDLYIFLLNIWSWYQIKDLLDPKRDDLPIRQDRKQNIIIPNLTEVKFIVSQALEQHIIIINLCNSLLKKNV